MDQAFASTPSDAVYHYHSVYDSQRWQEQYADPGFVRHVSVNLVEEITDVKMVYIQIAIAKHLGLLALRLTDAIILPLNTTQYTLELHQYLKK